MSNPTSPAKKAKLSEPFLLSPSPVCDAKSATSRTADEPAQDHVEPTKPAMSSTAAITAALEQAADGIKMNAAAKLKARKRPTNLMTGWGNKSTDADAAQPAPTTKQPKRVSWGRCHGPTAIVTIAISNTLLQTLVFRVHPFALAPAARLKPARGERP
jgi:hypothetical protein